MYLYKGFVKKKKGSHYLESDIWASALLHNSTSNYKWFFKGKKTIVSVTQTHFESSTYVNELTEGALLFFWEFTQRRRRRLRDENVT